MLTQKSHDNVHMPRLPNDTLSQCGFALVSQVLFFSPQNSCALPHASTSDVFIYLKMTHLPHAPWMNFRVSLIWRPSQSRKLPTICSAPSLFKVCFNWISYLTSWTRATLLFPECLSDWSTLITIIMLFCLASLPEPFLNTLPLAKVTTTHLSAVPRGRYEIAVTIL